MEHGWVYVLVNSAMPGLAKVGRTCRPPAERAAELSGVSGVPTPFVLVFDQGFENCCEAERAIHDELDRRGLRAAPNREFFRGSVTDIIRIVQSAADGFAPMPAPQQATAEALLAAGDRHLFGSGETLQDTGEAARCYKLAATRGALLGFERLGRIYVQLYAERQNRTGRRRALAPLKEGARLGNYYCYCELAALFAIEAHTVNFAKSWDLFFARRASAFLAEVEGGQSRFPAACGDYIAGCLALGVTPVHGPEMRQAANAILAAQLAALKPACTPDAVHHRALGVLRWTYLTLMHNPVPTPATYGWSLKSPRFGISRRERVPA